MASTDYQDLDNAIARLLDDTESEDLDGKIKSAIERETNLDSARGNGGTMEGESNWQAAKEEVEDLRRRQEIIRAASKLRKLL